MAKATGLLPLQGAQSISELPHIRGLQLADPQFYAPGNIDILLAENVLDKVMLHQSQHGPPGTPSAWNTIFGWAIRGFFTPDIEEGSSRAGVHMLQVENVSGDECLRKFWEVEELPSQPTQLSLVEAAVDKHYVENTVAACMTPDELLSMKQRTHSIK